MSTLVTASSSVKFTLVAFSFSSLYLIPPKVYIANINSSYPAENTL